MIKRLLTKIGIFFVFMFYAVIYLHAFDTILKIGEISFGRGVPTTILLFPAFLITLNTFYFYKFIKNYKMINKSYCIMNVLLMFIIFFVGIYSMNNILVSRVFLLCSTIGSWGITMVLLKGCK